MRAEKEHSRSLKAKAEHDVGTTADPEESAKDNESLKLYEDLTDLSIANVKIKSGKGGKEVTFNCIQTIEGRSMDIMLSVDGRSEFLLEDV